MSPLLEVRDLVTAFHTDGGVVHAVNGISYTLDRGEALALVGESGSGKTVSALSLLGLLPHGGQVERGTAHLDGRDLLAMDEAALRRVRGNEVAMVFQDPMTSLNPVLTIGRQLTEGMRRHLGLSERQARDRAVELLERVGIPEPGKRLDQHPHQFSGGQRQRIMIAMALSCDPAVLIADEPTTALDVTIQAQIVELVKELQEDLGMAILWITHDLALVARLVDRVAVMYAGHIVEQASVSDIYASPRHPYTLGLLQSLPTVVAGPRQRLHAIKGRPPDLHTVFRSCPFEARCAYAVERCSEAKPPLLPSGAGHTSACWRHEKMDTLAAQESDASEVTS